MTTIETIQKQLSNLTLNQQHHINLLNEQLAIRNRVLSTLRLYGEIINDSTAYTFTLVKQNGTRAIYVSSGEQPSFMVDGEVVQSDDTNEWIEQHCVNTYWRNFSGGNL